MAKCLGDDGGTFKTISGALDQIGVAERLINEFKAFHADRADLIDAAYLLCRSPIIEEWMSLNVFEVHVRQLLRAVLQGDDLDQPTMAEVAVMTCRASEKAPPDTALALMILGDQETMAAFGQEAQPCPEGTGDHYWPELTRICKKTYRDIMGAERSLLFKRYIAERNQTVQRRLP
jgi:hypothetical protein